MKLVFALLSVAFATTTHANGETGSPVQKVVKLLTDMQTTLKAEAKAEQDNYEKLACWCETNNKEKNQAILDNENLVRELEAEIETRTKRAESLEADIKAALADQERIKESIGSTEEQREKAGKANQAQIIDLTKNIQAMKGAIVVLSKHQASAFPQLKLDFLSLSSHHTAAHPADELDRLSQWMDDNKFGTLSEAKQSDIETATRKYVELQAPKSAVGSYTASELATLALAKKLVTKFAQVPAYANQSGEIFGILTQLKEQMEEDLSEVEADEAKNKQEAKEMLVELNASLAETEEKEKRKIKERGDNGKALSDAKEAFDDAENSLSADNKFLKELVDMCATSDKQWEERSKNRQMEQAAVSEALSMLTADDSKDLFSSSMSFVQERQGVTSVRKHVADVLRKAGQKAKNPELIALSASVQLDGFVKVKKAIDDMIVDLKQQQGDEVKHKDFCNNEFQTNEMETMDQNNAKKDLDTKIDGLDTQIEELKNQIATAKAELQSTKVELQRANVDRVAANKEFQNVIADQRATQKILTKVQDRLREFYDPALIQSKHKAMQLPPNAPVKFGEYKNNEASGSVITMIENLIVDAENMEKEAIADETTAQQDYDNFVSNSNASMAAYEAEIVDKIEIQATAEKDLEQAKADLQSTMDDLEALAKYAADVHSACDFVLKNFDTRQTARQEEMDALAQAKAILSGMQ